MGKRIAIAQVDGKKYVIIKPSGVDYDKMTADMMVVTDIDWQHNGRKFTSLI